MQREQIHKYTFCGRVKLLSALMWCVVVLPELLALLGAFLFGLGTILVRRGLVESSFLSAAVTVTLIGTVVFWIVSLLLVPLSSVNFLGIVFFALAGLFAPGFAMLTHLKGMEMLGASMNASIFAAYPLFSSLLAVFVLDEHPSLGILVGMICTIFGVVLIERNLHGTPVKSAKPTRMALAFPLSAALFLGFGYVLKKMGLNAYNEPILGVAIAYMASLCLYILLSALSTTMRRSISVSRQSLQLFWKPGLIFCVAHLCEYYALRYGDVSLVAPLMNIEPFFVFIFAYILLRELEKITYKLVIGTLIIVAGVSLITIF